MICIVYFKNLEYRPNTFETWNDIYDYEEKMLIEALGNENSIIV